MIEKTDSDGQSKVIIPLRCTSCLLKFRAGILCTPFHIRISQVLLRNSGGQIKDGRAEMGNGIGHI